VAIISFKNNPLQGDFVYTKHRKSAYVGAIRAGKTVAAIARMLLHCDQMPGSRYLIGRKRFTDLYNTTLKELFRIVALRNGGAYDKSGPYVNRWDGQFHDLYLKNGSVIHCRHVDEVGNVLGLEISGYMLDQAEEVDEEIYYHLESRLSYWNTERRETFKAKHGFYPKHFSGLVANPDPGWLRKLLFDSSESKEWKIYETDIEHNRKNLGPDYIESLYRTHPKDWCDRFLKGSWDIRGGQIYKEYNDSVHVIEPFKIPDHWERYISMDWGINEFHRCVTVWYAVDEKGTIYIYRELSVTGLLASQVAQRIKDLSAHDKNIPRVGDGGGIIAYFDPSCDRRGGIVERTIMDEFAIHGVYGRAANNDVEAGINKVSEALHVREDTGKPGLLIFNDCTWIRRGFKLYQWQPIRIDGTGSDKPLKKDDDEMDSVRYGIMAILEDRSTAAPKKTTKMDAYDREILNQMLTQAPTFEGVE
jgi:phage terminase large subunit